MGVRGVFVAISCLALGLLAGCREAGELDLPPFPDAARGDAYADIALGPFALWLSSSLMPEGDPDAGQVKRILSGLKWVRVRTFKPPAGSPPEAQMLSLRRQLAGPDWSRIVQTHDQRQGEDVEVYIAQDEHTIRGLAVLVTGPEKVTVVNVVGTIDPRDVRKLGEMAEHSAHKGGGAVPVIDPGG